MKSAQATVAPSLSHKPRRPYAKPQLTHYGYVKDIVRGTGNNGNDTPGNGVVQSKN